MTDIKQIIGRHGVVRELPDGAGGKSYVVSDWLSRKEAAAFLGMGINDFRRHAVPRRKKGHRSYHIEDLKKFSREHNELAD